MGMSRLPAIFLLAAAKSAIAQWTENSKSNGVLKVVVNKNRHVGKRQVN